jgi:hypothetical protein
VLTGVTIALWLGQKLMVERKLQLKPAPTNLPLLGFLVTATISLGWGIAFRDPLVSVWGTFFIVQVASLVVMILLPGAFLLVGNCLDDIRWLKAIVGLVLVTGTVGLAQEGLHLPLQVNILGIFPMWAAVISFALAIFNNKLPLWQRGLLLAITAGWVWYGYFRSVTWLASWLPTFAALAVVSVMRSKWAIIAVLIVMIVIGWRYVQTHYEGEMSESGETRLAAWRQNWQVTGKHLLFGVGPAGYAAYYMTYYPDWAMATHSNYIDILSQTGIVGLVFCLWFFGVLLWQGYRLCGRLKGRSDFLEGLANAAFAGTVGCVMAMGIGDWMFPFAYTQTIAGYDYVVYNWLLMGLIPALHFMTRPQVRAAREESV